VLLAFALGEREDDDGVVLALHDHAQDLVDVGRALGLLRALALLVFLASC
jgi:hypothetical protein